MMDKGTLRAMKHDVALINTLRGHLQFMPAYKELTYLMVELERKQEKLQKTLAKRAK